MSNVVIILKQSYCLATLRHGEGTKFEKVSDTILQDKFVALLGASLLK